MTEEKTHAPGRAGRGYCGKKTKTTTKDWPRVACDMCKAAYRADQEAKKRA